MLICQLHQASSLLFSTAPKRWLSRKRWGGTADWDEMCYVWLTEFNIRHCRLNCPIRFRPSDIRLWSGNCRGFLVCRAECALPLTCSVLSYDTLPFRYRLHPDPLRPILIGEKREYLEMSALPSQL